MLCKSMSVWRLSRITDKQKFWQALAQLKAGLATTRQTKHRQEKLADVLNKKAEQFYFTEAERKACVLDLPGLSLEERTITTQASTVSFERLSESLAEAKRLLPAVTNKAELHRLAKYYAEHWVCDEALEEQFIAKCRKGEADVQPIILALKNYDSKKKLLPYATKETLEKIVTQYAQSPLTSLEAFEEDLCARALQERLALTAVLPALRNPSTILKAITQLDQKELLAYLSAGFDGYEKHTLDFAPVPLRAELDEMIARRMIELQCPEKEMKAFIERTSFVAVKNLLGRFISVD